MTKSELIKRLVNRYPQFVANDLEITVRLVLEAMFNGLINGQRIEIRGFGAFVLNYRAPRLGRNPKSGDTVEVPAKYVPHFRAGRDMRERVTTRIGQRR
jgi:integration host factor subunit beta